MSDYNNTAVPPSGPPPPPPSRTFMSFKGKDGVFEYSTGKGDAPQTTNYVTGRLRALWLEWDPGRQGQSVKDSVPARWELILELESPDHGGMVKIDIGPATPVYILGSQLMQVGKGDYIGITLRPSRDTTLTELAVWDGQSWSHRYTPKNEHGLSSEQRYEDTLAALTTHPAWAKPAPRRKDRDGNPLAEPPLPGGGRPGAPPPPPPAPNLSVEAQAPAGWTGSAQGAVVNPASAAPGPVATPPVQSSAPAVAELSAFGYRWVRVPPEAKWSEPITDKQRERLAARLTELMGLGVHVAVPTAHKTLLDNAGLAGWPAESCAGVALLNDFLGATPGIEGATLDQIRKLGEAATYDPFADE